MRRPQHVRTSRPGSRDERDLQLVEGGQYPQGMEGGLSNGATGLDREGERALGEERQSVLEAVARAPVNHAVSDEPIQ